MKMIAVNGSPRKNWNTHVLLEKALEGAQEMGAEVELIHLYDVNFKGCVSCFACKRKGVMLEKCAFKDDLEPILQKICDCDALVLGSPIYFSAISGEMKSFWERLLFPYTSYEGKPSLFKKKINTALIYTMNAPSLMVPMIGYSKLFKDNQKLMKKIFGNAESLVVTSTYQFDDYSKYAMTFFNGAKRLNRHQTVFLEDCQKAFLLGKKLCTK